MIIPENDRVSITDKLRVFYDANPYPQPVDDLDSYRQRWQDEDRRRWDFHLHWPDKPYRTGLTVLVAGCGTSQAAKYALRQPADQVVGIDISVTSIRQTDALKRKYHLDNLELYQLAVECVGELDRRFDKIVCTGVLHHLPDPDLGLRTLANVLEPDGAMHLMVYAVYGRAGIYMLQEYCSRLGIGYEQGEIQDLAMTLMALPQDHPLARLLGNSPDFKSKAGLADALLNPHDRAYTVSQLFDFIGDSGLKFGRWIRQAPYLARCGSLAGTPHAARLIKLPPREQFAAVELLRGNMLRHNLIVYRQDRPGSNHQPWLDEHFMSDYVPIRFPDTISLHNRLPAGAAAVLINQAHVDPDLILPVDNSELQLVKAIDGEHSIAEILNQVNQTCGKSHHYTQARDLFERLFWYDQVVFNGSNA